MNSAPLTKKQVIREFGIYLNSTEADYQRIQKNSNRIYRRTTRIVKTVFSLIGILLAINIYFIYDFGDGIVSMVSNMDEMYIHFANMADQVHGITLSVEKMAAHIEVLPNMSGSIDSMNHTVNNMNANVQLMQSEVKLIANDVNSMNQDITDINYRFDQVNNNMTHIGSDMDQISRTIPNI